MGMGSGSSIGGKGGTNLSQQPGANAGPPRSAAPAQYSQPYQQRYMPPQQMQFSMAAPPSQYVQQPYNLSNALNTTNLASQQQMSRPITTMPINYPSAQTQQMQQPPRGIILSGYDQPQPQQRLPQQYFTPQQYQQDPYMNYVQNQQQALQQRAIQSANVQNAQQAEVLRQQQTAQQGARLIAQREAAQGGGNATPYVDPNQIQF